MAKLFCEKYTNFSASEIWISLFTKNYKYKKKCFYTSNKYNEFKEKNER